MRDFEFILEKLSLLSRIEITCFAFGRFWDLRPTAAASPIRTSEKLRTYLSEECLRHPDIPVVMRDEHDVLFAAIMVEDSTEPSGPPLSDSPVLTDKEPPVYLSFFLIGPSALRAMNPVEAKRYFRHYNIGKSEQAHPPVLSYARFISLVQLAAIELGRRADEQEIIRVNGLDAALPEELPFDQLQFSLRQEEEEAAHHSYMEERILLDCVREGRTEDALHQNLRMDQMLGQMSKNRLDQWRKLVTVAVALTTRAAIEGGLPAGEAYKLSDFYLQKSDTCEDVPALIACRNEAVRDFCDRVASEKRRNRRSPNVQRTIDYIHQHYREKIYLDDIADMLKVSPSYLSRCFSSEVGTSLQEYVVQVRVERASNLLLYSDETIAAIGDYVGFPSQSYFGSTFKKYTGITPRQFRDAHKNERFS